MSPHTDLHAELERLAEHAPEVRVDPATFDRAQRARRRDRGLVLAAVVAVLALVGGIVTHLPGTDREPPAVDAPQRGSLAVPSQVWGVPDWVDHRETSSLRADGLLEGDLAIGTGAAAFVTDQGRVVVVDAARGGYHLLDLPGWNGTKLLLRGPGSAGLALSPDGTRLAYAWSGRATATAPVPSGVRVVDLRTGGLRTVRLAGGEGTIVSALGWSANGRWLVWSGGEARSWTRYSLGGQDPAAGRISVGPSGDLRGDPLDERRSIVGRALSATLGVDDRGTVWVQTRRGLARWRGGDLTYVGSARAAVPLAETGLTGTIDPGAGYLFYAGPSTTSAQGVRLPSGRPVSHRVPDGTHEGDVAVEPLGFTPQGLLVAHVTSGAAESQLVVMSPRLSRTSTYRIVGHLAPALGRGHTLSVATGLMQADAWTAARDEPDWPWSDERKVVVATAVAVPLLLVLGVGWLLVRRRRYGRAAR